jgi:hypothetical protein
METFFIIGIVTLVVASIIVGFTTAHFVRRGANIWMVLLSLLPVLVIANVAVVGGLVGLGVGLHLKAQDRRDALQQSGGGAESRS